MRWARTIIWIAGLGLSLEALAQETSNPYQTIVERNVFALKPPPSNLPEAEPPPPPVKIVLTGITTLLGNKRAIMSVPVKGQQLPESYMLTEGQRQGEIEVLQIDEKAGMVRVKNHGIEQTLDFDKDGAKAAPAAAATAATTPGVMPAKIPPPPMPPGYVPNPNAPPAGQPGAVRTIPTTRSMRVMPPTPPNQANPQ